MARWHRRPQVEAALAWLAASYIRLVHRSGRWQLRYDPATAALVRARRPFIGAFWHGRMLMIDAAWRTLLAELQMRDALQPYVISSDHRDGRFMAKATARFGLKTVFGSTKHGAVGLLRVARRVLADGQIAVVTPDGPKGPRMRAKPGVVRLAMKMGVPVVPITFAADRQRLLKSWDRFALVWPFSKGVLAFGAPIEVGADADAEALRLRLEHELSALTAEADRAVGREPVEPAD
jgi:lysophospholipid acyltransferase (LPLAT)-like uncharacterized protein